MLAIFPPILGARLILKPEIMMFAYLPWIILLIYKFLDTNNLKYLFLKFLIIISFSLINEMLQGEFRSFFNIDNL